MDFNSVVEKLRKNFDITPSGFFNVEGGEVSVTTDFFDWCICATSMGHGERDSNHDCGRSNTNYFRVPAGDGDGIYVVNTITHKSDPKQPLGAFVVMDKGYGIANSVRSQILGERLPQFPEENLNLLPPLSAIKLGSIQHQSRLLFSDAGSGKNSKNAIVDVRNIKGSEALVFAFVQEIEPNLDAWISQLDRNSNENADARERAWVRAQASGKELFRQLGRESEYSLPSIIPRVLMVAGEELQASIELTEDLTVSDWTLIDLQFSGTVGASHAQPMHESTIWMNVLLAREYDRAAPENLGFEETKELLFESWTWAYQGLVNGDQDCVNYINGNSYKATNQEIAELLTRRGLFSAAEEYLSKSGISATTPLSKKSEGLSEVRTVPTKFCSNCGAQLVDLKARFCSSCGSPIS